MDRDLRRVAGGSGDAGGQEALRRRPEQDRGNLLDARERDQNERYQQHDAKGERKSRPKDKIMTVPEMEDGSPPGANHMGREGEQERLTEGDDEDGEDV